MKRTKSFWKRESCMKLTVFIIVVFIFVGCSPQKAEETQPKTEEPLITDDQYAKALDYPDKAEYSYYKDMDAYYINMEIFIGKYIKAIRLNPDNDEAYCDLVEAFFRNLMEAIRQNPDNSEAYCDLAEAFFHIKDIESNNKAFENYARALKLNPNDTYIQGKLRDVFREWRDNKLFLLLRDYDDEINYELEIFDVQLGDTQK